MSTISNRFFVTAIDDGTTLHGSLNATKTLTQAWNGTASVPDWTVEDNRPIVYLSLYSGATTVANVKNAKWLYDGVEMKFDGDVSTNGLFEKTTYGSMSMPALKIINNIAVNNNYVDTHIITFEGSHDTGNGATLDFSASIQLRVSVISSGGYLGVLEFQGGKSNLTQETQTVTAIANLFKAGSETSVSADNYSVEWYVNDVPKNGTPDTSTGTTKYTLTINANSVTDNAIVRADFKGSKGEHLYSAYASVDDLTDPEYLYIQYNGENGQSATLRKDEEVTFDIWVGKMDDPTPIFANWLYEIKLLDANGEVVEEDIEGLPSATGGWRTLRTNNLEQKAYITITYPIVTGLGRSITGIIRATEQEFDFGGDITPQ